jgi:hypothetical protein
MATQIRQTAGNVTTEFPSGNKYYQSGILSFWRQYGASSLIRGDHKSPNPYSYSVLDQSYISGRYIQATNGKIQAIVEGCLGGSTFCPLLNTGPIAAQAYNEALGKMSTKVRGQLDLATSLAESGQTGKMLNLVKRLTDTVTDMKRSYKREILDQLRSWKGRRGAEKALRRWQKGVKARHPGSYRPSRPKQGGVSRISEAGANGWLEYTYGLKPLISDIHGIAENVVGFARNHCALSATVTLPLDKSTTVAAAYSNWSGNAPVSYQGHVRCRIGLRMWTGYDDGLAKWSSLNPLSVAYELVPYSFVLDWVFDLGSYMRNLETSLLMSTSFRDGWMVTSSRYTASSNVRNTRSMPTQAFTLECTGGLRVATYSRSVLTSYPAPRIPSIKLDLGSSQLLSAAALLRQLIK